jgi:hypothetical protein
MRSQRCEYRPAIHPPQHAPGTSQHRAICGQPPEQRLGFQVPRDVQPPGRCACSGGRTSCPASLSLNAPDPFCRVGESARVIEIPDRFLPLASHVVDESAIRGPRPLPAAGSMGVDACGQVPVLRSRSIARSRCECVPGEVAACAALGWVWWLAVRAGIAARAFPPAGRRFCLPCGAAAGWEQQACLPQYDGAEVGP